MTRRHEEGRALLSLCPKLSVVVLAALAIASCSATDAENEIVITEVPDATGAAITTTDETTASTIGSDTEGTVAPTDDGVAEADMSSKTAVSPPAPLSAPDGGVEPVEVSVSIDCSRGISLSDLGIDLARIPFVEDTAPDATKWVDITITVANPTGERIQVDPGFEVTFTDIAGLTLASQPWVDDSDPIWRAISGIEFIAGPEQTVTRRIVVFEGFSGRLFLRDSHDLLLASLNGCAISSEPVAAVLAPDSYPAEVTFQLDDCGPDEEGINFEATLTATNNGVDPADLNVRAEMVDQLGDRFASFGTNENPLVIAPGATETMTIAGSAWLADDLSNLVGCRLYYAKFAGR